MNAVIWLILMILFLLAEAVSVTMISLWFALGALGALIVGLLGAKIWLQVLVFFVISIVTLASLRPWSRKYFNPRITRTNVDSVIGTQGRVIAAIDNIEAKGQVKLGAMEWTARSTSGDPIPEGTLVTVDRIEGVKVFVSPVVVPEAVQ